MRTSKHWKKEVCKNLSNLELHYFIGICKQKERKNGKGSSFKNKITIHIIEIHWRLVIQYMVNIQILMIVHKIFWTYFHAIFKDPLYYLQWGRYHVHGWILSLMIGRRLAQKIFSWREYNSALMRKGNRGQKSRNPHKNRISNKIKAKIFKQLPHFNLPSTIFFICRNIMAL